MNRKVKQKGVSPVSKSRPRTRAEPGTRMSVLLANPDYLLEGFAEKRCKYIGVMDNVPTSQDLNNRSYLLKLLDSSRNAGKLPWKLGLENEVTVTISAFNMKIIKEDRTGNVLHRLPIHEIGCCCYVDDDEQHLLFVRAGDSQDNHCPVHVFSVARRADAEEVCTILREVFQLVYTEATLQQLNLSITAGERGGPVAMATGQTPSMERGGGVARRKLQLSGGDGRDSDAEEESEEIVTAEELVQDYMTRLHQLLDFKELRDFASLLKQYRDDLPVSDFLHRLQQLYGTQRSFLIPGMRSFIPEEDRAQFETFLIENSLPVNQSDGSAAETKPHPPPDKPTAAGERRKVRRGRGQVGGAKVADVDQFLADIDSHAQAMLDTSDF